jgi:hypothetical protein
MGRRIHDPSVKALHVAIPLDEYMKIRIGRKEVMYQGKMHDIRSVSLRSGLVHLEIIPDEKEHGIATRIRTLFSDPATRQLLHFFMLMVFLPAAVHLLSRFAVSMNYRRGTTLRLIPSLSSVELPPPEIH